MMEEVNVVELDGKTYIEVDIIKIKDKDYAFLIDENDESSILIRRVVYEGNESFYETLDSADEIKLALAYFAKNHSDMLSEFYE